MELAPVLVTKSTPAAGALTSSAVLSLLASMYLCKPTADAIANWRDLMSGSVPEPFRDLSEVLERINLNSEEEMQDLLWILLGCSSAPIGCHARLGSRFMHQRKDCFFKNRLMPCAQYTKG